jgi:ubiquinone/menaquinone biosynthesis C-methylase UbiE
VRLGEAFAAAQPLLGAGAAGRNIVEAGFMPSLEKNKTWWNDSYDWTQVGDEWSKSWGGPQMQWYGSLLPRIHAFLPAQTILEIAPGFGRWTQFLKDMCDHLIAVDLSEKCIQACQKRFADASRITYHVNDGKSLAMVPDDSIDFVFSFDSLVHAEDDVILAYISQLGRILKKDGAAFIHHSNLGEYPYYRQISKYRKVQRALGALRVIEKNTHWRALTVTAAGVAQHAADHHLRCISQEKIPWGTRRALIDCMSVMVREDARWARDNRVLSNPSFKQEKRCVAQLARLYNPASTK